MLPELEFELSKLENQASRYHELYAKGLITFQKLESYLKTLERKRDTVQTKISKLNHLNGELIHRAPDFANIETLSALAASTLGTFDFATRKKLIQLAVERVVIGSGLIEINGYIPFDGVLCLCHGHIDGTDDHNETSGKYLPFSIKKQLTQDTLVRKKRNPNTNHSKCGD
jgi:hypothetical protein